MGWINLQILCFFQVKFLFFHQDTAILLIKCDSVLQCRLNPGIKFPGGSALRSLALPWGVGTYPIIRNRQENKLSTVDPLYIYSSSLFMDDRQGWQLACLLCRPAGSHRKRKLKGQCHRVLRLKKIYAKNIEVCFLMSSKLSQENNSCLVFI